MDTRKYKLINITIVIATIILLIAYGETQVNLNNAKNHRNLVASNLVEENKKEEFKLGEFLNRLRRYNDLLLLKIYLVI